MKKLIAAALALAVTAPLCGCNIMSIVESDIKQNSFSAGKKERDDLKKNYKGRGYACLKKAAEQDAYAAIDVAAKKLQSEEFEIESGSAFDNFGYILEFYKNDNPDVFWIRDDSPYSYVDNGDTVTIELEFKTTGDKLARQKVELDTKVRRIVSSAPKNGTDYEKELYINSYIVDNCQYDREAAELHKQKKIRGNEQDIYGALVEGSAVCEGYARAFSLLCQKLNVECSLLEGYASEKNSDTGKTEREAHIWNCVKLDGKWYHTDVTWNDDTSGDFSDVYSRRYYFLNLTTEEITRDHEISPLYGKKLNEDGDFYNEFIPECNSDDYNYFKLNCPVLSSFDDVEAVTAALTAAASNSDVYFDFLIDKKLDFSQTKSKIAGSEGAEWIAEANSRNGDSNQLGDNCSLVGFEDRRLITFLLKYE